MTASMSFLSDVIFALSWRWKDVYVMGWLETLLGLSQHITCLKMAYHRFISCLFITSFRETLQPIFKNFVVFDYERVNCIRVRWFFSCDNVFTSKRGSINLLKIQPLDEMRMKQPTFLVKIEFLVNWAYIFGFRK